MLREHHASPTVKKSHNNRLKVFALSSSSARSRVHSHDLVVHSILSILEVHSFIPFLATFWLAPRHSRIRGPPSMNHQQSGRSAIAL
jgi:hypothetical protein